MKYIKSACDRCHESIEFPRHAKGEYITCPHCNDVTILRVSKKRRLVVASICGFGALALILTVWGEINDYIRRLEYERNVAELARKSAQEFRVIDLKYIADLEKQITSLHNTLNQRAENDSASVLAEMKRANRIAEEQASLQRMALIESQLQSSRKQVMEIRAPATMLSIPSPSQFQQQQNLDTIARELERIRQNGELNRLPSAFPR